MEFKINLCVQNRHICNLKVIYAESSQNGLQKNICFEK